MSASTRTVCAIKALPTHYLKTTNTAWKWNNGKTLPGMLNTGPRPANPTNPHMGTGILLLRSIASKVCKIEPGVNSGKWHLRKNHVRSSVTFQDPKMDIKLTIPDVRVQVEKQMNEAIKTGAKIIDHGFMPEKEALEKFGSQIYSFADMKFDPERHKLIEIEGHAAVYMWHTWPFLENIKELDQIQIWQTRIKDVKRRVVFDLQVFPDGERSTFWQTLPRRIPRWNKPIKLDLKPLPAHAGKPAQSKHVHKNMHEDRQNLDHFSSFY